METPPARREWETLYRSPAAVQDYDRRFRGRARGFNNRLVGRAVARELRRLAGGRFPARVIDTACGPGRFTDRLRARGARPLHLDQSVAMLRALRVRFGPGWEVAGDLRRPPLAFDPRGVLLCLRLFQHLGPAERIEILGGFRRLAPRALVAWYPGWHIKCVGRRLRHALGLPHPALRETLAPRDIRAEARSAGWRTRRIRPVLPGLSENVLVSLEAAP